MIRPAMLGLVQDFDSLVLRAISVGTAPAAVVSIGRVLEHGSWHAAGWLGVGLAGAIGADHPGRWLQASGSVGVAYIAAQVTKPLFRRPRPQMGSGFSFPSAHATAAFAGAHAYRGGLPGALLWTAAVSVALSRVRVRAHHASDVIAGGLLGVATSAALTAGAPPATTARSRR